MKALKVIILTVICLSFYPYTYSQDTLNWNNEQALWDAAKAKYNNNNYTQNDLVDAKKYITGALEIDPGSCKYKYGLGLVNYKLENWNSAEIWFEQVVIDAGDICMDYPVELMLDKTRERIVMARANDQGASGLIRTFDFKDPAAFMTADYKASMPKIEFDESRYSSLPEYIMSIHPEMESSATDNFIVLDPRENKLQKHKNNISYAIEFFERQYSFNEFSTQLIIILSDDPNELIRLAEDLYPEEDFPGYNPYFGFYSEQDKLLVATSYGGYGTVFHELMHAYISKDFPEAPLWLEEGLATIYERANWKSKNLVPLPNWRLNFIMYHNAIPLNELPAIITNERLDKYDLAYIRLFFLYLDYEGLLNDLYQVVLSDVDGFQLSAFINDMGIEDSDEKWKQFVERTIEQYRIELELDKSYISYREVIFIQRALNLLIDAGLEEDGYWGPNTESALIQFKQQHGLNASADYDKECKDLLNSEFEKRSLKL